VYLFLFGSFFLWTYVPRYLDILGWSGTMIGIALAARTVAQGSAMLIWSFLADRWRAGSTFVRIQVVLGWLAVFMLVWTRDPYGLVAILTLYGLTVGCTAALWMHSLFEK
jgi:predicted MFS family arabinose efflux permease